MNTSIKGLAGALLGLALGAAIAGPAHAVPTMSGPSSPSDYGVLGIGDTANAYQLTLSYMANSGGLSRTLSLKGTGFSYGSNGSYSPTPNSIGSFGGEDFRTSLSFNFSNLVVPIGGSPREYRITAATLELPYTSITGMPVIAALATGLGGNSSALLTSGNFSGQSFTLQPSGAAGIARLSFDSTFTGSLNSFLGANAGASPFVQVALSATNGGAGVPGPVAGAGLPFLAAAGLAWARRRRRARTGS